MPSLKRSLLLIVLSVLAGCASQPAVVYQPPKVPPLPAEISTKRQPNLSARLYDLLQKSPQTETEQSTNSTPASTPIKK